MDGRDLDASALQQAAFAEVSASVAPASIVFLAPPPHGADLGRCYSPLNAPSRCLAAVDQTWYDMQAAAEAITAANGGQAVSSLPISCVDAVCPAFAGSLPIRYDENHLTVAYAEHITDWIRWTLSARGLL